MPKLQLGGSTRRRIARRSLLLLASSSVAALMIGGGAPPALAGMCAITPVSDQSSISNAGSINCINLNGITVTGRVTNASTGIITANGGVAPTRTGIGVSNADTFAGGITNSGTISAGGAGININSVTTFAGGISNGGTIAASFTGIFVNSSAFSGGVVNSGMISAGSAGMNINGVGVLADGIVNAGTIAAGLTGIVVGSSAFSGGITNSGTISSGLTGIGVFDVGAFAGGITNSGTIASSGGGGISLNTVSEFRGGIGNAGSIAVAGTGIEIAISTFAGGITNSGTISSLSSSRVGIAVTASQFSGGIGNAGTITVGGTGIQVTVATFAGGIANSGRISAGSSGINVNDVSTFVGGISNGGTISSQRSGIFVVRNSTFSGGIANIGTIAARFTGIFVNSSAFSGGVTNSGVISAGSAGININTVSVFAGGIANTGTIAAGYTGVYVSASSSFSGGITNGGMISAVSAAININGVNAFAGGITNSGTISSSRSTGVAVYGVSTFGGGMTNSGTISSLSSGRVGIAFINVSQFSGGIGNVGTITAASGTGIEVTAVSTFAGGITNGAAGRISTGSGIAVTDVTQFAGGIGNGGKIATSHTGIFVGQVSNFSGNINNAGTITAATGIRISSGVSFAAGTAIVNSGTITGLRGAIDVSAATSPVTIDQAGGTINGAIKLSSNADVLNISGGAINGNVIGAGSRNTINFALGAGNSFTYSNNFAGIDQVNINSGMVVLNGNYVATSFDVKGGTLAGLGIIDPLTVTIHSGATLQPGAPGTAGGKLNIVGSLVFQSAAVYLVTINGASASYTSVTGTATLGGAQIAIAAGSTVVVGQKYTILTDTGGGLGSGNTFAGLVGYDRLRGTISYDANDVYVTFQWAPLGPLLPPDAPVNVINTAAAIDNFTKRDGALPAGFQALYDLSPAQLGKAFTQLSGESATGAQRNAFLMTTEFLNVMLGPLVLGHGADAGDRPALGYAAEERPGLPDDVALAYASIPGKASAASFQQRWSAWGTAYGGGTTSRGDPSVGSHDISAAVFGFAGGMDYHVTPSTLVGFALAGGGTNWRLANALGTGRSDALQAGGYGISRFGPAYIAGALSFSNHWFTSSRSALGDELGANFIGQSYGARFEGGYRYGVLPMLGVTPYGAVQVQKSEAPAYSERDLTAGGFGLSYAATNGTDMRTEFGARFDTLTWLCGKPLMLYGRAAWAHDFVGNPAFSAAFEALPGSTFTISGAPIPRDTALTTVGAQWLVSANWTLTGAFNGDFASGSRTYSGNGKLRYSW